MHKDASSKEGRQRVLTVGREASGSIPNAGEGGVRLEEVCHDLCAINTELVASDAANENQSKASGVLTVGKGCAATYLSETKTEFCFRSYARSMASPTFSPQPLKPASVWSALIPQSVVSWDLPCTTSRMAFAPSSPMSFRRKERFGVDGEVH